MPQAERTEMHKKMTPEARAAHQADRLQKRLKLSDAQTAKIREVNLQTLLNKEKEMAVEDRKELRQARMETMKKREEMYSQVLTKDQMDQFRALKKERMDMMKERRADHKKGREQRSIEK